MTTVSTRHQVNTSGKKLVGIRRNNTHYTIIAILLLCIMLFPVYWMINTSFQPGGTAINAPLVTLNPDLSGYRTALADQGQNILTSLLVAFGTVLFSLSVAAPAAYALSQYRARWVNWVLLGIIISQMIPNIVIANAIYGMYNTLGLLNTILGLVLANSTQAIPFALLILRAQMGALPPSLVEAARVDGAGLLRAFVSIVIPVIRNGLITAGLFSFLFAWSDFLFALTLTTTEDVRPVTLGIFQYLSSQSSNWGAVMATATLASVPAIIMLLIAQRHIGRGVSSGAVK